MSCFLEAHALHSTVCTESLDVTWPTSFLFTVSEGGSDFLMIWNSTWQPSMPSQAEMPFWVTLVQLSAATERRLFCLVCQTKANYTTILLSPSLSTCPKWLLARRNGRWCLYKAGHNLPFISRQTGAKLRTTQQLVQCFKNAGEASTFALLPKSGRPLKTSLRARALISRQVAIKLTWR